MTLRRALSILAVPAAGIIPPILPPPSPPPPEPGFPAVGTALFYDDGGPPNALDLWGSVDCAAGKRVVDRPRGGDSLPAANGVPQDGPGYRRVTVRDGDDYFGERCELGRNDHRTSPVALFREGERRITYLSLRLGKRFPLNRTLWQSVMQMKQSQPADSGGGSPIIGFGASNGHWRLTGVDSHGRRERWSVPARRGSWTRFAFDVVYSTDPALGYVRAFVDRNRDGDAGDAGERSGRIRLRTLKREGPGDASDGLAEGDAIPSHLRVGIYHDPSYRCRRSRCSMGIDNVGIYAPRHP